MSLGARAVATIAGLNAIVERIVTVWPHGIVAAWSIRVHEVVTPVRWSFIVVWSIMWPSLLLAGLTHMEIIVTSEWIRWHELAISLVMEVLVHLNHTLVTRSASELTLKGRILVVVSLAWIRSLASLATTKSSSDLKVGLLGSSFHVSALVPVFIVLDGVGIESILSRPAFIVTSGAWTSSCFSILLLVSTSLKSSPLLLVPVLWTFNILFILFVLVGFWVVPTLFLLFLIAILILVFTLLIVFGVE